MTCVLIGHLPCLGCCGPDGGKAWGDQSAGYCNSLNWSNLVGLDQSSSNQARAKRTFSWIRCLVLRFGRSPGR